MSVLFVILCFNFPVWPADKNGLHITFLVFAIISAVGSLGGFIGMEVHQEKPADIGLGFSMLATVIMCIIMIFFGEELPDANFAARWGIFLFPGMFASASSITLGIANRKNHDSSMRIIYVILAAGLAYLLGFLPALIAQSNGAKPWTAAIAPSIIWLLVTIASVVVVMFLKGWEIDESAEGFSLLQVLKGMGLFSKMAVKESYGLHKAIHKKDPEDNATVSSGLTSHYVMSHIGERKVTPEQFFRSCCSSYQISNQIYEDTLDCDISNLSCNVKVSGKDVTVYVYYRAGYKGAQNGKVKRAVLRAINHNSKGLSYFFRLNIKCSVN